VHPGQRRVARWLGPEHERRAFEPADAAELNAQLRLADRRLLHGVARGRLVNIVVDRECQVRPVTERAHRRRVLE
jgi:hypothetical protein